MWQNVGKATRRERNIAPRAFVECLVACALLACSTPQSPVAAAPAHALAHPTDLREYHAALLRHARGACLSTRDRCVRTRTPTSLRTCACTGYGLCDSFKLCAPAPPPPTRALAHLRARPMNQGAHPFTPQRRGCGVCTRTYGPAHTPVGDASCDATRPARNVTMPACDLCAGVTHEYPPEEGFLHTFGHNVTSADTIPVHAQYKGPGPGAATETSALIPV